MKDVDAALCELGLNAADSVALRGALAAGASSPAKADSSAPIELEANPPPQPPKPAVTATAMSADVAGAIRCPPRGWPETAGSATPFISKELRGTKVRMVGALGAQHAAPLVGLALKPHDAKSNAVRVRDRTGWAVLGGYVLAERATPRDAAEAEPPGWVASACGAYVGVPHYWNATPRGLWVDATPRPHAHLQQLILVEAGGRVAVPPPPYEAKSTNPLVIVAAEGLCNRLRAVTSYRQVARAATALRTAHPPTAYTAYTHPPHTSTHRMHPPEPWRA